jgi:hypothetical protein
MSITRLQQARQMYAMGKRVERAFGGVMGPDGRKAYVGGSYSDQGGYQGQGGAATGGAEGSPAGGEGTGTDGQGGTGGEGEGNNFNAGPEQIVGPVATNLDVKEQYGLGTPTTLSASITPPDFTKVGPGTTQGNNYIDRLNLQGATYKPPNLPFLGLNFLSNTIGKLGFTTNKDFFEKNVAGKYGYGYGLKDFEKYMSDRMAGEVGAYGNENMGQNAINANSGGDDGIMSVYNNPNDPDDGDSDGDGDSDQDDFIFRYFDKTGETLQAGAGGVEDLMTRIRQRINDIFTT